VFHNEFCEITKSECDQTNIKRKNHRRDVTMKNGTRKKTDNVLASPKPRDLRAEVEKRAYEIWPTRAAVTAAILTIGFEPSVNCLGNSLVDKRKLRLEDRAERRKSPMIESVHRNDFYVTDTQKQHLNT
jgi:hypothetical protein